MVMRMVLTLLSIPDVLSCSELEVPSLRRSEGDDGGGGRPAALPHPGEKIHTGLA